MTGEGDKEVWIEKVQTPVLVENTMRRMADGTQSQTRRKRKHREERAMPARGRARLLFGQKTSSVPKRTREYRLGRSVWSEKSVEGGGESRPSRIEERNPR